jgi:hypothetical protein
MMSFMTVLLMVGGCGGNDALIFKDWKQNFSGRVRILPKDKT